MPRRDDGWVERFEVFLFLTAYTTGLWGSAGRWLPAPFNGWHALPAALFGGWWQRHVLTHLPSADRMAVFDLAASWLLALVVPILALRALRVGAVESGLALPRKRGLRVAAIGIAATLPAGFWLVAVTPNPWASVLQETCGLLAMVPEHFLIFGVYGVLLLPGRRLAWPSGGAPRFGEASLVVMGSAVVFWLVHVGTRHPAELWVALPLGAIFASMTVLSESIWPAILAHAALNVVPMALPVPRW